jgi:diguanylate cyclase (GGDEF)-like protein
VHGHAIGDEVLREVADVVRGALRTADVCCRTGGDEFMILLPETDARGARQVMARLRGVVIRAGARRNLPISISVGSATWPVDGPTAAALVGHADRAMYGEKRRLRGRARRKPPAPSMVGKLSLVK